MILANISGPIIGAVIGYCTNFIAVKMLFRPRKEIRIGSFKVPFTPGAIPKGQPRLAKAAGDVVANTLLTEEDIRNKLLSSDMENAVIDKIMGALSVELRAGISNICPDDSEYDTLKANLTNTLTTQIMESIDNLNLKVIIAVEAKEAIKKSVAGTMLAMFVTDELLDSVIMPMGDKLEAFIADRGADFVQNEINNKLDSLEQKTALQLCEEISLGDAKVRELISKLYSNVSAELISGVLKSINISGMIEDKINEMKVEELEKVVLTVMKKELNMIVNLGALIGAIIGTLNIIL